MGSELTYKLEQTDMDHYIEKGVKYRKITGHCWTQLEDLENVYKRRGHRTWLNFGDICSDLFILTVEMTRPEEAV